MSSPRNGDVVIVGGGVMGCAIAFELAKRGRDPVVLERSVPGAEASSAAAGMLAAQVEAHEPGRLFELCLESRALFPELSEDLRERTGIDIEHRRCGILRVAYDEAERVRLERHVEWQSSAGHRAEMLEGPDARRAEPALSPDVLAAARFPDDGRVDPPRLLRALRIAAERAGARFRCGALVRRIVVEGGRARGAELEGSEVLAAEHVVLAAGSWSSLVPGAPLDAAAIRPARGQIVELTVAVPVVSHIPWSEACYLSPRDDGRLLIGSTMEFVGFERAVTAGAVRDLLDGAIRMVPSLRAAEVARFWSSFRPHSNSELPYIGASSVQNLWLATGHFRNGILLAPHTARAVAELVSHA